MAQRAKKRKSWLQPRNRNNLDQLSLLPPHRSNSRLAQHRPPSRLQLPPSPKPHNCNHHLRRPSSQSSLRPCLNRSKFRWASISPLFPLPDRISFSPPCRTRLKRLRRRRLISRLALHAQLLESLHPPLQPSPFVPGLSPYLPPNFIPLVPSPWVSDCLCSFDCSKRPARPCSRLALDR